MIENGVKQIILTGAPGTGKTYTAEAVVKKQIESVYRKQENILDTSKLTNKQESDLNKYISFVQFHSSYDYADFVEGLRPTMIQKGGEKETAFVKLDGTFKKFCREAAKDKNKDNKYFFIIDEINRADLSRVFGELMYGLEESYRGEKNRFATQYQNLPTYEIKDGVAVEMKDDVFQTGFYIPENVYIIGTMNDIDRSVETFDFALRRRFHWYEVQVADEMDEAFKEMFGEEKSEAGNYIQLRKKINGMNCYIAGDSGKKFGLNESYQIGHAYFKDYDGTKEKVEEIFKYRIKPLLREYCRGRDKEQTKSFIKECEDILTENKTTPEKGNGAN